jgi:RimJ/RimL family protein N-acetyltransferase
MKMVQNLVISVLTFFGKGPTPPPTTPLFLSNFIEKKTVTDDTWNKIKDGQVRYEYFQNETDKEPFAMIDFRPGVGQIGIIGIWPESNRNRGLGKQMLRKAMNDIKAFGKTDTVWAVTSENHTFWSNVFNKSFIWKVPAHDTVTGHGYSFKFFEPNHH